MRGRPVADGVAWPIPSISGAHAHYAYSSTAHAYAYVRVRTQYMYRMRIANAQRRGLALYYVFVVGLITGIRIRSTPP